MLAGVWVVSMAYMWLLLDRGWVPHDEGTLGQSALRVLHGQVPHRDFEEIYTGGLTYLNALAFELWGVRLMAMRYMAYIAFACWIPVVYYLASGWGPAIAAGATLAALAWSYPNYPAAMPSWYTLYFGTGAAACLMRYVEVRRVRWLAAAGVLAGIACLFKIVGLYLLAGSLLFLLYLEQRESAGDPASESGSASSSPWYRLFATTGLVGFGASVFLLVRPRLGLAELVQFVLPSWVCVGFLVASEWRDRRGPDAPRFRTALGLIGPFIAGFALPILALAVWFLAQGGLEDLVAGVLVKPFRRLTTAAVPPPPVSAVLPAFLVASLVWHAARPGAAVARRATVALGALAALLLLVGWIPGLGELGYLTLSQSVPLVVFAAVLLLWNRVGAGGREGVAAGRLALLAFLSATYTLVQYPLSTTTYFTYVAPLVLLAGVSVISCLSRPARGALIVLPLFYACYAVLWLTPWQYRLHNSRGLLRDAEVRTLLPGLAGLEVSLSDWREYETLVSLVSAKAKGEFIFAGPDSPEVYFLTGRANPTRTLFDFFDEQEGRTARILSILEQRRVQLVVINNRPLFSGQLDPVLATRLRAGFPHDSAVGRFTVRWK